MIPWYCPMTQFCSVQYPPKNESFIFSLAHVRVEGTCLILLIHCCPAQTVDTQPSDNLPTVATIEYLSEHLYVALQFEGKPAPPPVAGLLFAILVQNVFNIVVLVCKIIKNQHHFPKYELDISLQNN